MNAGFWFSAGVITGVTATAVALPLWRGNVATLAARPRAYIIAAGGLAVFACSAALLYVVIGSPASLEGRSASVAAAHPVGSETPAGSKALSMEAATARLEARLQRDGGSANDWQLLAQSYDFLGRGTDASRARARAGTATPARQGAGVSDSRMPSVSDVASQAALLGKQLPSAAVAMQTSAAEGQPTAARASQPTPTASGAPENTATQAQLERQLKLNPRDPRAWLELAELHRRNHEADAAREAYEKLIALHAMTAQSWADYADVLGTRAGGSLAGAAARAIEHSLALDPINPKALWLDASRAFQEKRYNDALGIWKRLRGVLAPDSPDMPLVDANIAEALQLAQGHPSAMADGGQAGKSAAGAAPSNTEPSGSATGARAAMSAGTPAGTGSAAAEISGTVSIERRLAGRVDRDATLFIYAKAADSPGPPLAVMRLAANTWPVSFRLDDSMAMLPSRRLSQFQKVIVEARISRSGQAAPTAGDFYVTSSVLSPSSGKKLALVIDHEIG